MSHRRSYSSVSHTLRFALKTLADFYSLLSCLEEVIPDTGMYELNTAYVDPSLISVDRLVHPRE